MIEFPNLQRAGVPWQDLQGAALAWAAADDLTRAEFVHQVAIAGDVAAVVGALVDGTLTAAGADPDADQVDREEAGPAAAAAPSRGRRGARSA